jgi:hypothetical protein
MKFQATFALAASQPYTKAAVSISRTTSWTRGAGSTSRRVTSFRAPDLIRLGRHSGGNFDRTEITGGNPVLTRWLYGTITEPGGAPDRTISSSDSPVAEAELELFVTYALDTSVNMLDYRYHQIAFCGGGMTSFATSSFTRFPTRLVGNPGFIDLHWWNSIPHCPTFSRPRAILTEDTLPLLAWSS